MTEQHTPEFEAFCDEHGFDYASAYPEDQQEVKAAWTAWQAARATPADHSSIIRMLEGYAESYEMMARQEKDAAVRCSSVAVDIRQNMAKWVRDRATPADQEPVGKNWQERVQLRMLSMPENPNAPDVIGPVYNPVEVELRATPSADAVDAKRYRYLRTGEGEIFAVYGSNGVWGECGHMNIYEDQLDAEIDKAIAASAPKGDGND